MDPNDLIKIIKETINSNLDEKLKTLPTKSDIEDLKVEIVGIGADVSALKRENQELKDELNKVQQENNQFKKDINWLQNQIKPNKLFIKGITSSKNPMEEAKNLFRDKLNISTTIKYVKKVFDRNGKMAIIIELENEQAIQEVFRNTKKLAGSNITIERDMIPTKQLHKRIFLILKKKILSLSKQHKIVVREDKMKIKDQWFKWNSKNKLVSGNDDGEQEFEKLYGDVKKNICLNYDQFFEELYPKNQ